jgi:ABC-type uncharacterized transport system ATPase subunit
MVTRMNEQTHPDSSCPIIRVLDLQKDFGYLQALSGISFDLNKGEFLTIFGPNGAGKTNRDEFARSRGLPLKVKCHTQA